MMRDQIIDTKYCGIYIQVDNGVVYLSAEDRANTTCICKSIPSEMEIEAFRNQVVSKNQYAWA